MDETHLLYMAEFTDIQCQNFPFLTKLQPTKEIYTVIPVSTTFFSDCQQQKTSMHTKGDVIITAVTKERLLIRSTFAILLEYI